MKLKEEPGGIANQTNGCMPPRPGEGYYICHNCGNRFNNTRNGILSEIIGGLFVSCPQCGSVNTTRDPMVVY